MSERLGSPLSVDILQDKNTRTAIVLKRFQPFPLQYGSSADSSHGDLLLIAYLAHPQLPRAIAFARTLRGEPLIALEHIEAIPLTQIAQSLSPVQLFAVTLQLGRVLHYLEGHNVIHGALTSATVHVRVDPRTAIPTATLLDFSKAHALTSNPRPVSWHSVQFHPPVGIQSTTHSDLHSLGTLLYECVTGKPASLGSIDASRPQSEASSTSLLDSLRMLSERMIHRDTRHHLDSVANLLGLLATIAKTHDIASDSLSLSPYFASSSVVGADTFAAELLNQVMDSLHAEGSHRLLGITGPSGSGKTRILREVARSACRLGSGLILLNEISPSLLQDLLQRLDRSQPLLLLDDPIDIDDERLHHALEHAHSFRRICVLTTRAGRLPGARRFDVPRLTQHHLELAARNGLRIPSIPQTLAATLYDASAGNPGIAWHCLESWIRLGLVQLGRSSVSLACDHTALRSPAPLLPSVEQHLASLPDSERAAAAYLSLSPHGMCVQHLASAMSTRTTSLSHAIDELCSKGLAIRLSDNPKAYSIAGEAIRTRILTYANEYAPTSVATSIARTVSMTPLRTEDHEVAAAYYEVAGDQDSASESLVKAGEAYSLAGLFPAATRVLRLAARTLTGTSLGIRASRLLVQSLRRQSLSREALQIASSVSHWPTVALDVRMEFVLEQALLENSLGHFVDSAAHARAVIQAARTSGNAVLATQGMLVRGEALCALEKRRTGKQLLLRALSAARRLKMSDSAKTALTHVASCLWKEGQYRLALGYEQRRVALSRRLPTSHAMAFGYQNLAILNMELGRFRRAEHLLRAAFHMRRGEEFRTVIGPALINLSEIYRLQGRYRPALAAARRAVEVLRHVGDNYRSVIAQSNMGLIFARAGAFRMAHSLLKNLLSTPECRRSPGLSCAVLRAWATFLFGTGRSQAAIRVLSHLIRVGSAHGLTKSVLEWKCELAHILLTIGRPSNSHSLLYESRRAYADLSSFDTRLRARLVGLLAILPRAPRSLKTRPLLDRVISRCSRRGMSWHASLGTLGKHALASFAGDVPDGYAELLHVLSSSRASGNRTHLWHAYYWIARIHERRLQQERALHRYGAAIATILEIARELKGTAFESSFLSQPLVQDALLRHSALANTVAGTRREREARLETSERRGRRMLASLSAIGQQLSSTLDLNELLGSILAICVEHTRADRGIVFLVDDATDQLIPSVSLGRCDEMASAKLASSMLGQLQTGRAFLARSSELQTLLSADIARIDADSLLCIPMMMRRRYVGAIYLDTRLTSHRFGERERAFVESLAGQAAVAIENARLFGQMRAENVRLHREVEGRFRDLIGSATAMRKVQQLMLGLLNNDSTVLLTGESGTGKGMVARAIHTHCHRQAGPFIAVDCGALPENLLEAELFGYRRGAFTGADQDRIGLIEEARGGTLFLDEIGNTSPGLQSRLLRVLQEKEIRRLGENDSRPVNVRIIAATNADLRSLMSEGRFRQDLFYRLNVVSIDVPPLRHRLEDLTALADHFLRRHTPPQSTVKRLGPGVLRAFGKYHWPGNVRELEHVIERLILLTPGEFITVDDLPDEIRPGPSESHLSGNLEQGPKRVSKLSRSHEYDSPKTGEQIMIEDALRRYAGDKAKVARFIGWNRQKLYRRMRSFGIAATFGRRAA